MSSRAAQFALDETGGSSRERCGYRRVALRVYKQSRFANVVRMSAENAPQPPIEIPVESLSPEILHNLIESFVLREGTDYGSNEVSLDKKIEDVQKQFARGILKIAFDPNTETVTVMTKDQWRRSVAAAAAGMSSGGEVNTISFEKTHSNSRDNRNIEVTEADRYSRRAIDRDPESQDNDL